MRRDWFAKGFLILIISLSNRTCRRVKIVQYLFMLVGFDFKILNDNSIFDIEPITFLKYWLFSEAFYEFKD